MGNNKQKYDFNPKEFSPERSSELPKKPEKQLKLKPGHPSGRPEERYSEFLF